MGNQRGLSLEGGIIYPQSPGFNSVQLDSPVEASRRPGTEGRVSYRSNTDLTTPFHSLVFGVGGYTANQFYNSATQIHSWAVTGDWQVPLSKWIEISGEIYRGRSLGGLGGGLYKDILTGVDPITGLTHTVGVETAGGWNQVKVSFSRFVEVNAMFGLDDAFSSSFRSVILPVGTTSLTAAARNSTVTGNLIFRPRQSSDLFARVQASGDVALYGRSICCEHLYLVRGVSILSCRSLTAILLLALPISCAGNARSQMFEVSAHVELTRLSAQTQRLGSGDVVVWLTPLDSTASEVTPPKLQSYTLAQKDKEFLPHLLVLPVGSKVDFPNLDPFFHNVFSLFNGKRFDLGLYEGHSRRSVQFDREGVSFIFCNIHPDMGAVVVSLSTPYYSVSASDGLRNSSRRPTGTIPSERVGRECHLRPAKRTESRRRGRAAEHTAWTLHLEASGNAMSHHTNKFGEPYKPALQQPY